MKHWLAMMIFVILMITARYCVADVRTVVEFDRALGEFPEGIAVEAGGDLLVGFATLSTIERFAPDGMSKGVIFQWPGDHLSRGLPGLLGLEVDAAGRLYAAIVSCFPAFEPCADTSHGVWHVNADGGPLRVPGSENIPWPNAIAAYQATTLYISDTLPGAVWRAVREGDSWTVERWSVDPLLAGDGSLAAITGAPMLGANGIVTSRNTVWVANTELGSIVGVPVLADGSAGTAYAAFGPSELCLPLPPQVAPCALDGLSADVHGRLYAAVIGQNSLVRADPGTGEVATLVGPEGGLQFPASLAFGTGDSGRRTVYVTNFATLSNTATPGIVALDSDAAGQTPAGTP